MKVWRAHGLGNDYLVYEAGPPLVPGLVQAICDRHRGVGSDGVLAPVDTDEADYGVRIWNPDGSVAEKSGNGLRIYARWLADNGATSPFSVWTGYDRVVCEVSAETIRIEMGTARFSPASVPVQADGEVVDAPWTVEGDLLAVTCVGVGNPHCVIFRDETDLDRTRWRAWGAALETDERFPNRTNVQVARVTDDGVEIRIHERGAGPTLASGSSSCAVAAAAVRTGRRATGRCIVRMPGGTLVVTVREDWTLLLEGPVERVGRVELDPGWVKSRTTPTSREA